MYIYVPINRATELATSKIDTETSETRYQKKTRPKRWPAHVRCKANEVVCCIMWLNVNVIFMFR